MVSYLKLTSFDKLLFLKTIKYFCRQQLLELFFFKEKTVRTYVGMFQNLNKVDDDENNLNFMKRSQ